MVRLRRVYKTEDLDYENQPILLSGGNAYVIEYEATPGEWVPAPVTG